MKFYKCIIVFDPHLFLLHTMGRTCALVHGGEPRDSKLTLEQLDDDTRFQPVSDPPPWARQQAQSVQFRIAFRSRRAP